MRQRPSAAIRVLALALFLASPSVVEGNPPEKRLKVFILAGQSNMEGHGVVQADPKRNGGLGSLEHLVKSPKTAKRFGHLVDADGKWRSRKDVWIWYLGRQGELTVGYGARDRFIGPELQFGHVVGDHFDHQVLLIKTAWGGKSLAVDFRPPSSGKIPYPVGKKLQARIESEPETLGRYYRQMLAHVRDVLKNLEEHFPAYDGRGYEIIGLGWHQGWNDRVNQAFNDEYEKNLADFIRDVRKDLGLEKLPFVIAETGMHGSGKKHPRALSLMRAQAAVAKYPEFKGNVAFVGTQVFQRPREASPSAQGYHWNHNAETHFLIGDAMGKAMVKLLDDEKEDEQDD
ncbi:MAG: sialate O-acetylesterase [Planctomycetota bacterium]|nr:sialate O-acetylesterase [Planctomycetota bacterium]